MNNVGGSSSPSGGAKRKLVQCGENDVLHIYAQRFEHDDAQIVGTREALIALRDYIDHVLHGGTDLRGSFAADGEGYWIEIKLSTWEDMNEMPPPYMDYWDDSAPKPGEEL